MSVDESHRVAADPSTVGAGRKQSYVPPIDEAELARRNQAVIRLLDAWEADEEGEEEQRETLAILKVALGEQRSASSRNLFP